MIVLVGANSWLVSQVSPVLAESDSVHLVGRTRPDWLKGTGDRPSEAISFAVTNYRAGDEVLPPLKATEKLTVVFAGVGTAPNLLANIGDAEVRDASESHIVFPLSVVRQVAPHMISAKFGRFIFLGSSQGSRGIVGAALYTTVKAAHRGLSRSIAVEYGRFGITSNVIDAGFMDGGQARFLKTGARESFLKSTPSMQPVKVADIASAIQHLIGSASVSGAILTVDAAG